MVAVTLVEARAEILFLCFKRRWNVNLKKKKKVPTQKLVYILKDCKLDIRFVLKIG